MVDEVLSGSRIEAIKSFYSDLMDRERDIYVYLPEGYDEQEGRQYPVVYMHAGQRVFPIVKSRPSWHVEKTLDKLIAEGTIEPVIVVAIAFLKEVSVNGEKVKIDYMYPLPHIKQRFHYTPNSPQYAQFIIEELIPHIEKNYRVRVGREHRKMIGSSAGALCSYHIGMEHSDVFSGVGLMSLFTYMNVEEYDDDKNPIPNSRRWLKLYNDYLEKKPIDMWVDVGDSEKFLPIDRMSGFIEEMQNIGFTLDDDLVFHIEKDATHQEPDWGARLDKVLMYLLHKKLPNDGVVHTA